MKCIKYVVPKKNKTPSLSRYARLADHVAHDLVRKGEAVYVPKREFKENK